MIIFLYGSDDYRRHQTKEEIAARSEKNHKGAKPSVFDMENKEQADAFEEFIGNQPIFETVRSAMLEHSYAMDPAALAKLLKPLVTAKNINVLLSERKKPVKELGFLLKDPVRVLEFEDLKGLEWFSFVKKSAKNLGLTLNDDAVRFLSSVYEGDTWALVTELQKLASFKSSIARKDLDAFGLQIAPDYWPLINGMKSGDMRNRITALEKLFSTNDPAAKTFNMLASQWREKTTEMAEYDFAVKSGKLNYEEVLLALALG